MNVTAVCSIILNGEPIETGAQTLEQLVAETGFGNVKVATAINGDFVAATERAGAVLKAGDRVEVVSARQGG